MSTTAEVNQAGVTSVFKKLPWHTNVLAHLDDPQAVPSELKVFRTALRSGLEKQTGPNIHELTAFFQQQIDPIPHKPLFDHPFTPHNRAQTASLVISYRVLDVFAFDRSPPFNKSSFEVYGFKDPPHMNYKGIYNWKTLVVNSPSLLEGAVNQPPHLDDGPRTPANRTYRHFVALCRTQVDKRKIIPQVNFETAALHLSYLLEGHTDLPDSSETFVNIMRSRSPPGAGSIGKPFQNYVMQQLRSPLHIALTVSPLCLIGPMNLNKASPGRPGLCQVWQALGSPRPTSLKWVESKLWDILWDYTLHKIELLPALQETIKLILTRLSEWSIPTADFTWFTPLKYIPPPKTLQHELKNLRLTPPPVYSESESELTSDESLGDIKSATAPLTSASPTPLERPHKRETKSPQGPVAEEEEESSHQESDRDMVARPPRKPVTPKAVTGKRKKPPSTRRKFPKPPKSVTEVQTPSTQNSPLLPRNNIMPPYVEIIDLSRDDQLANTPPLDSVITDEQIIGKTTHQLYTPDGALPALYTPQSHLKEDVQLLTRVVQITESFYMYGKPRFMVDPPNSCFSLIPEDKFGRLTDQEVQNILRIRQLVIVGPQNPPHKFDLNSLETLTGLTQPIPIYDHSISLEGGASRLRKGTLLDIYTSAGFKTGKSLITLDFPMACASAPPKSFASDVKAWSSMAGASDMVHEFPTRSTKWGQASTAGAYHMWRIQRDGFATYIEPQAGRQCWIVARPKDLNQWDETFWKDCGHMRKYTIEEGSSDVPDPALWYFEAILLKPGTRLILRPNTPYLSIMPEPSICHGARFYATSTILESCHGIFYTFLFNTSVNIQHSIDSRRLLRRMLAFYHSILTSNDDAVRERNKAHVPQVNTLQGLLSLLTLCNVIEMGNILTPKLYTDKDKCNRERHELIEARKLSRTVVDWVFDNHQLSKDGTLMPKSRSALYWPYLAQQAKTLLWHKQQVEQEVPPGDANRNACTYETVKHAIRSCFRTVVPFWTAWDACQTTRSFTWSGPQFSVVAREPTDGHHDHDGKTMDDLIWLGESEDGSDIEDSFSKEVDSEDEHLAKKARQG